MSARCCTPSAPLRVTRKIALPYQDILRLLTLWFKYGGDTDVEVALMEAILPAPHRTAPRLFRPTGPHEDRIRR